MWGFMHHQTCIEESAFLYCAGLFFVAYVAMTAVYHSYRFFVIHFTPAAVDYRRFGEWALVTGATDGIGKGIATELSKLGINIVLVSRNPVKLKQVATELEQEFNIATKCVTFDFKQQDDVSSTDVTSSIYDVIRESIEAVEVGILVNNVGTTTPILAEYLKSFSPDKDPFTESTDLVNCNVNSMAKVTQIVLPQMVRRKKGLIINISSMSISAPCPTFSIYSGSKKFNDTFSRALCTEYKKNGIVIHSIKPGFVATSLTIRKRKMMPGLFFPLYLEYVKHMMRTVGKARATTGYWCHHLLNGLVVRVPERLVVWFHMRSK